MNRKKKKRDFEKINETKNDGKKLWNTLNQIMGRSKYRVKIMSEKSHSDTFSFSQVDRLRFC